MKEQKPIVIKCPRCDCEYLPGEIYIPDRLVGQPKDIERTVEGKISLFDGQEQELEESFVCEKCGKPFKVVAHMSFETTYDNKSDFTEEYHTHLFGNNRIHLNED